MFAVVGWRVARDPYELETEACLGLTLARGCLLELFAYRFSAWAGTNFEALELLLALGLRRSYVGLVSSIGAPSTGIRRLTSAAMAATFSGFMHFVPFSVADWNLRMNRNRHGAEHFHDNALGLHIRRQLATEEHLRR